MSKKQVGILIGLIVNPKLKQSQRAHLFRKLYGWHDQSQYGKYQYERKGLLSDIPHVKLMRGVFIIRKQDKLKIIKFLKGKAKVVSREVILTNSDKKTLFKPK